MPLLLPALLSELALGQQAVLVAAGNIEVVRNYTAHGIQVDVLVIDWNIIAVSATEFHIESNGVLAFPESHGIEPTNLGSRRCLYLCILRSTWFLNWRKHDPV